MGTKNARLDGPLTVDLTVYKDGQWQQAGSTQSAADGSYGFDAVETGAAVQYVAGADYQGATYATDPLTFGDGDRSLTADITVYAATQDAGVLHVAGINYVVERADAGRKRLSILQIVQFENRSDRTYVPSSPGGAGSAGLLQFTVPPGVRDLNPGGALSAYQLLATDGGFASAMPVKPGSTSAEFAYDIDYSGLRGASLHFEEQPQYPSDSLLFLVADPRIRVSSAALADLGQTTIGNKTYRQYQSRGQALPASVTITITGLPGTFPIDPTGPIIRYGAAALTLLFAGLAVYWGLRGPSGRHGLVGRLRSPLDRAPATKKPAGEGERAIDTAYDPRAGG